MKMTLKKGKAGLLIVIILAIGFYASPILATPSLIVATDTYRGEAGQTVIEPYQAYFADSFIPGGDSDLHGFVIGGSPTTLTIATNIVGSDIYLLTTEDVFTATAPTFDGMSLTSSGRPGSSAQ